MLTALVLVVALDKVEEADVAAPFVVVDTVTVVAALTTFPVAVGFSPSYAYTGAMSPGVTLSCCGGAAAVPEPTMGLLPGSLGRVPVAVGC